MKKFKKRKIHISKEELERLYLGESLSSRQIGKLYDCNKNVILDLMKIYGIRARTKSETSRMIKHLEKYKISKKRLIELYHAKNLSMQQIANIYGTYSSVICGKFKKYKIRSRSIIEGISLSIPRRSQSIAESMIKYPRNNFSGKLIEKAYLRGFRIGDLHVKKRKYGCSILVACSSTKQDQITLFRNLFERYGHVYIAERKGHFNFYCNLNNSFYFLLNNEDKIDDWILGSDESFFAFLAGYIDAEGHFGVHNNFGEFSVSSNDKNILKEIYKKLLEFGIIVNKPRINTKKGYIDKRGVRWNKDIWRFRISRKNELFKFINLIESYIKHKKRYKDMLSVKNNLIMRGVKSE